MNYNETLRFLGDFNERKYGVNPFEDTERKDEGELTPEEKQVKADELREAFDEISEAGVEISDGTYRNDHEN